MSLLAPETIDIALLPCLPFEQRFALPNVPGVYFVLDTHNTVLYIGQTVSLCCRWRTHEKMCLFQELPALRIAYMEISDTHALYMAEKHAIYAFAPRYNERGKDILLPYKLRMPVSQELRLGLKDLARSRGLTLQKLVEDILKSAVMDPPSTLTPERSRRKATSV
jgi:hypothetical protein